MAPESTYADILRTVVENGRITNWSETEVEVEVEYECGERGLSDAETAEAVAWAIAHTETR